jgi:hypothetical protein
LERLFDGKVWDCRLRVAVALSSVQQTHYFFVTTLGLDQWAESGQGRLTHLDEGLSVPANMTSCGVIFELFNQAEPEVRRP